MTENTPSNALDLMPIRAHWQDAIGQVRSQIDSTIYNSCIRDTQVVDFTENMLTIATPSEYARQWLSGRLASTLRHHLAPLFGRPVQVQFIYETAASPAAQDDSLDGRGGAASETAPETSDTRKGPFFSPLSAGSEPVSGPAQPVIAAASAQVDVAEAFYAPVWTVTVSTDAAASADAVHPVDDPVKSANDEPVGQESADLLDQRSSDPLDPRSSDPLDPRSSDLLVQEIVDPTALCTSQAVQTPEASQQAEEEAETETIELRAVADTIETALLQPRRIIAFPRYELRFIPLVGPEAFFLRLAFLQERFFHTDPDGRSAPFETSVESLLRWANVGRATLHRFKKGDAERGQVAAAGWFGIEQLPSGPRSAATQHQPPCRYRVQQGVPLTPMDADRLYDVLVEAGIQSDPVPALRAVCSRPIHEILQFPPPAPSDEHQKRTPAFTTPATVVQKALAGRKIDPADRPRIQEWTAKLTDHITMPQQLVFVSWYFMQHWLPLLGHDAAALVLYARSQGYYNPQDHELRDVFAVPGGYRELASVIGFKRDRTIGDWLPNLYERAAGNGSPESEKWQAEQQRQRQVQALIGQFVQVVPGSRWKTEAGNYGFKLQVEIQGEPLTPADQGLRDWVESTLAACADAGVLPHFHAWVTALDHTEGPIDGAGILGKGDAPAENAPIDGWGILGAQADVQRRIAQGELTARESDDLDNDGWGILAGILNDGSEILARFELTAGELFKGLLKLNTHWETILESVKTTPDGAENSRVVDPWDLREICMRNGGMNAFREAVIARESSAIPFMSWLIYAYSFKGQGIKDPVGWALTRVKDQPGVEAEGMYSRLAALPPDRLARWLLGQIETGAAPLDDDWSLAFRDVPGSRLRAMAEVLGLME